MDRARCADHRQGRVGAKRPRSGSLRCCAATMRRSSSARARISRTAACCIPTWAIRWRLVPIARSAIMPCCMAARIGDNSLIGMGAILLNGVQVGRNCLVGAHALLTEGKSLSGQFSHRRQSRAGDPQRWTRRRSPSCARTRPIMCATGGAMRADLQLAVEFQLIRA